jgi:cytochrome c biogenesis protein CcmG/thiol:disulfide interchange protein DsbE
VRRTVAIWSIAVLVVVIALSIFLGSRQPVTPATSAPSPLLGKIAPAVSGEKLGGGSLSLRSDLGHVVVLNFWASWCDYCRAEAPNLSTFAWHQRRNGVDVVGVVFNDSVSDALSFSRHFGSLYPSIIDPNGEIANEYGVFSSPTTFVINANGRIAATLLGPVTVGQLEEVIQRIRS